MKPEGWLEEEGQSSQVSFGWMGKGLVNQGSRARGLETQPETRARYGKRALISVRSGPGA